MSSGSLILEMGALSRLTGDPKYESAALRALRKLWSMRSSLNLLGTTLDVSTGEWIEFSTGIGAGRFSEGFEVFNVIHYMLHSLLAFPNSAQANISFGSLSMMNCCDAHH